MIIMDADTDVLDGNIAPQSLVRASTNYDGWDPTSIFNSNSKSHNSVNMNDTDIVNITADKSGKVNKINLAGAEISDWDHTPNTKAADIPSSTEAEEDDDGDDDNVHGNSDDENENSNVSMLNESMDSLMYTKTDIKINTLSLSIDSIQGNNNQNAAVLQDDLHMTAESASFLNDSLHPTVREQQQSNEDNNDDDDAFFDSLAITRSKLADTVRNINDESVDNTNSSRNNNIFTPLTARKVADETFAATYFQRLFRGHLGRKQYCRKQLHLEREKLKSKEKKFQEKMNRIEVNSVNNNNTSSNAAAAATTVTQIPDSSIGSHNLANSDEDVVIHKVIKRDVQKAMTVYTQELVNNNSSSNLRRSANDLLALGDVLENADEGDEGWSHHEYDGAERIASFPSETGIYIDYCNRNMNVDDSTINKTVTSANHLLTNTSVDTETVYFSMNANHYPSRQQSHIDTQLSDDSLVDDTMDDDSIVIPVVVPPAKPPQVTTAPVKKIGIKDLQLITPPQEHSSNDIKQPYQKEVPMVHQPNRLHAKRVSSATIIQRVYRGYRGRLTAQHRKQLLISRFKCMNCGRFEQGGAYCKECGHKKGRRNSANANRKNPELYQELPPSDDNSNHQKQQQQRQNIPHQHQQAIQQHQPQQQRNSNQRNPRNAIDGDRRVRAVPYPSPPPLVVTIDHQSPSTLPHIGKPPRPSVTSVKGNKEQLPLSNTLEGTAMELRLLAELEELDAMRERKLEEECSMLDRKYRERMGRDVSMKGMVTNTSKRAISEPPIPRTNVQQQKQAVLVAGQQPAIEKATKEPKKEVKEKLAFGPGARDYRAKPVINNSIVEKKKSVPNNKVDSVDEIVASSPYDNINAPAVQPIDPIYLLGIPNTDKRLRHISIGQDVSYLNGYQERAKKQNNSKRQNNSDKNDGINYDDNSAFGGYSDGGLRQKGHRAHDGIALLEETCSLPALIKPMSKDEKKKAAIQENKMNRHKSTMSAPPRLYDEKLPQLVNYY